MKRKTIIFMKSGIYRVAVSLFRFQECETFLKVSIHSPGPAHLPSQEDFSSSSALIDPQRQFKRKKSRRRDAKGKRTRFEENRDALSSLRGELPVILRSAASSVPTDHDYLEEVEVAEHTYSTAPPSS